MISMLALSRYVAQSGPATAPVAHTAADTADSMISTLVTLALVLFTAAAQQVNTSSDHHHKLVLHGIIITS